jgi:hypothetical protein
MFFFEYAFCIVTGSITLVAGSYINQILFVEFAGCILLYKAGWIPTHIDVKDVLFLYFSTMFSLSIFLSLFMLLKSYGTVVYISANSNTANTCEVLGFRGIDDIAKSQNKLCNTDNMKRVFMKSKYTLDAIATIPVLFESIGHSHMRVVTCANLGVLCFKFQILQTGVGPYDTQQILTIPTVLISRITIHNADQAYFANTKRSYSVPEYSLRVQVNDTSFVHLHSPISTALNNNIPLSMDITKDTILFVVPSSVRDVQKSASVELAMRKHGMASSTACPHKRHVYSRSLSVLAGLADISTRFTCPREVYTCSYSAILHISNTLVAVSLFCILDFYFNNQKKRNIISAILLVFIILSLNYIGLICLLYNNRRETSQTVRTTFTTINLIFLCIITYIIVSPDFSLQIHSFTRNVFIFIPSTFLYGKDFVMGVTSNFIVTVFFLIVDIGTSLSAVTKPKNIFRYEN